MIGNQPENGERLIDGAYVKGVARGENDGYASGIVAHSGGGQALATPLPVNAAIIQIDTVATADDSIALPVSDSGMRKVVINATANSLNLYASPVANAKNGGAPDKINGSANANAYAIGAGLSVMFVCAKAGAWFALKSA